MITAVAAAFSFGKMVRSNELVAMMASGVSLKRVIAPVILLALLLTGLLVVDQEVIIPSLSDKLVRGHENIPGQETYHNTWFVSDGAGSLICSQEFDVRTSTLQNPTILLRRPIATAGIWEVTGRIDAEKAVYNSSARRWDLTEGQFIEKSSVRGPQPVEFYASDITPKDVLVRRRAENKTLMSLRQLSALARQGPQMKDQAQLFSQKHFRVTEPIVNLLMLMVCLPILVCRDPKMMKTAVMISFAMVGMCFITTFVCKIVATEAVFNKVIPEFWAWLPVFIFLPLSFIEWDSMKT
jgi:lipopolysaccharide export system permease protein